MVLHAAAVGAQTARTVRKGGVVRYEHAAVAVCAQILRRKETERAERSERTDAPVPDLRADRLRAIFDDRQVVARAQWP